MVDLMANLTDSITLLIAPSLNTLTVGILQKSRNYRILVISGRTMKAKKKKKGDKENIVINMSFPQTVELKCSKGSEFTTAKGNFM